MQVHAIDLEMLKLSTTARLSRELLSSRFAVDFTRHRLPTHFAEQLVAQLKVPAQVLQKDRLIHRHPATLWDHIKQRLRARLPFLKRWLSVAYTEIRLNEHLVYPTIQVPNRYAKSVRLYVEPIFGGDLEPATRDLSKETA